jgi:cysteine-S-conjugate beta-lyase
MRDLTDEQLRASGLLKWAVDGPGVIPAWVAEMDMPVPDVVRDAVLAHAAQGIFGYADPRGRHEVIDALAGFARERWGMQVDPHRVLLTGDVMEGMRLTLHHLTDGGPVIVPTPVYPPFLVTVRDLGRQAVEVPVDPDADRAELDVAGIERAARDGARTLLLCHPHNPVGRCWTRTELEAVRDAVEPHGVHVVSDEIHAPLTLPGVAFTPYAAVASPDAPVTTLVSATKAFTMPGLRCAQVVSQRLEDHRRLTHLHPVLNHGMTTLGQIATATAYRAGGPWLDEVRTRVAGNHVLFRELMAQDLPAVRIRAAEATYLAWLDVRALSCPDPVGGALRAGVRIDGQDYGAGGAGHVRVNLGTSPERVREIVRRLSAPAAGWAAT